jgi:hypothetical protein
MGCVHYSTHLPSDKSPLRCGQIVAATIIPLPHRPKALEAWQHWHALCHSDTPNCMTSMATASDGRQVGGAIHPR